MNKGIRHLALAFTVASAALLSGCGEAEKPAAAPVTSPQTASDTIGAPERTFPAAEQKQEAPVEVSAADIFAKAIDDGNVDRVRELIAQKAVDMKTDDGVDLLLRAVDADRAEIVSLLARAGVNVNDTSSEGLTPLHYAARDGKTDVLKVLIDAKAKLDERIQDDDAYTALGLALLNHENQAADMLIKAGADVNVVFDDGVTALMLAASEGNVQGINLLVKTGKVRLDEKTKNGNTALMLAVREGNTLTAALLLKAGADANIRNKEKETAFDIAAAGENKEMIQLMDMAKSGVLPFPVAARRSPAAPTPAAPQ